jgi:hypothetical protein
MALSIDRQLPEEMLDHIISYTNSNTLARLCRVSRQFNRLATPRIHSTVTLGYNDLYVDNPIRISFLAHLLLTSTKHAVLVTSVVTTPEWGWVDEDAKEKCEEHPWPGLGTPELEAILRDNIARFQLPDAKSEEIYEKIKTGTNEDAIVALLILSLPNLRKLDMNFGFGNEHEDFNSTFELLAGQLKLINGYTSPPLDVLVKGDDDKYPNKPIHIAVLLHMPNIRSLYGWKMGDHDGDLGEDEDPFARLEPRSVSVEYIELRQSKLHVDCFRWMMNAVIPGRLKTLVYEIGCTWAWCGIFHSSIMASLRLHYHTLENLALSHEDFYPHQFGPDSGDEPSPCDFKPFTALKRLRVAPVYIWGHDGFTDPTILADRTTKEMLWQALPRNLEQLWICRADSQGTPEQEESRRFETDCLVSALHLLLDHKDDFPHLEVIRLEFMPVNWPKAEDFVDLEVFCRRAESEGISMTIILDGLSGTEHAELNWSWDEDVEWTECFSNQDSEKMWIVVAQEENLAEKIRNLRNVEGEVGVEAL